MPVRATRDLIRTTSHHLYITPLHHASVLLEWGDLVIYVDPSSYRGKISYEGMPKADLILITHEHFDHYDENVISLLEKESTEFIIPPSLEGNIEGTVLSYWESVDFRGIEIKAVPAYNLNKEYHLKGFGNGYLLEIGSKQIYFAGDTDCIPEMLNLAGIDIAFIPMREPYTMNLREAAKCIRLFQPKIVYPYHHGEANPFELLHLLKDMPHIEVRARNLF